MNQDQRQGLPAWLKGHWLASSLLAILILTFITIAILGYWLEWTWVGFRGSEKDSTLKTVWDWMGLLIIPAALGAGAYLFNRAERKSDREIAERRHLGDLEIAAERNREDLLKTYLDRMSLLMLDGHLRCEGRGAEARYVARARTLVTLQALDKPDRKSSVMRFLRDSELVTVVNPIISFANADMRFVNLAQVDMMNTNFSGAILIDVNLLGANLFEANLSDALLREANLSDALLLEANLSGANLSGANMDGANLLGANLFEANLSEANLMRANLSEANLSEANLSSANLSGADLSGADLSGADLSGADLSGAINITNRQLAQAGYLIGATLPDGTKIETVEQEAAFKQQYGQVTK